MPPSAGMRVLVVVVGLAIWYSTQYLIGGKARMRSEEAEKASSLLTQHDLLLQSLGRVNQFLNAHPLWANGLLIVSSALIDLLSMFLLLWSIFGPSIRP